MAQTFKIGDVVYHVGKGCGVQRESITGKRYYLKARERETGRVMRKILRCKKRMLKSAKKKTKKENHAKVKMKKVKTKTVVKKKTKKKTKKKIKKKIKKNIKSGNIADMLKSQLKIANKKFAEFLKNAPSCTNEQAQKAIEGCFEKLILPMLKSELKNKPDTFFDKEDGEYMVTHEAVDRLEQVEQCLLQKRTACKITKDHQMIDELQDILEYYVDNWISDELGRMRELNDNPYALAISALASRLDGRIPSIALVERRFDENTAAGYRDSLEQLENTEIDEFNVEPDFYDGNLMSNKQIRVIMNTVDLMASGDLHAISVEIEMENDRKKRLKKKKAAAKKKKKKK
jgi:hypothetical protein